MTLLYLPFSSRSRTNGSGRLTASSATTADNSNPYSSSSAPRVGFSRGTMSLRVCGPKLSLCCLLLSAWGVVQLLVMGISLQLRSIAFLEDLRLKEEYSDPAQLKHDMELGFEQSANTCFIAAALYVVTLVVSGFQYWLNQRPEPTGYQRYG